MSVQVPIAVGSDQSAKNFTKNNPQARPATLKRQSAEERRPGESGRAQTAKGTLEPRLLGHVKPLAEPDGNHGSAPIAVAHPKCIENLDRAALLEEIFRSDERYLEALDRRGQSELEVHRRDLAGSGVGEDSW